MLKLASWTASDVGRKREHNEDSFLADEKLGLFIVADGMGGHQGGDRASRLAVETIAAEIGAAGDFEERARVILREEPQELAFPRDAPLVGEMPVVRLGGHVVHEENQSDSDFDGVDAQTDPSLVVTPPPAATVLRAAARAAGRAIFDAAQTDAQLAGMGTTLTALLFEAARGRAFLVHVGDSRGYLIRDGHIAQLTEDHSWIAEQVRAGMLSEDEARDSKFKHIITRSVGFERDVEVDLLYVNVHPGDRFVLCSDGVSNYVDPEEIADLLGEFGAGELAPRLVELANQRGGDDNITAVVVEAKGDG